MNYCMMVFVGTKPGLHAIICHNVDSIDEQKPLLEGDIFRSQVDVFWACHPCISVIQRGRHHCSTLCCCVVQLPRYFYDYEAIHGVGTSEIYCFCTPLMLTLPCYLGLLLQLMVVTNACKGANIHDQNKMTDDRFIKLQRSLCFTEQARARSPKKGLMWMTETL